MVREHFDGFVAHVRLEGTGVPAYARSEVETTLSAKSMPLRGRLRQELQLAGDADANPEDGPTCTPAARFDDVGRGDFPSPARGTPHSKDAGGESPAPDRRSRFGNCGSGTVGQSVPSLISTLGHLSLSFAPASCDTFSLRPGAPLGTFQVRPDPGTP